MYKPVLVFHAYEYTLWGMSYRNLGHVTGTLL